MNNPIAPTHEQAINADGVLAVTLTNVARPGGGLDGFPLPTSYEVHPPADGETIDGQPVAGWLHTDAMLWAHQGMAVYRDLERLDLDVIPTSFRRADGEIAQALVWAV